MPVEQIVAEILASRKADYVASASLLPALDFVRDQGGDFVAEFVTSISIGIGLPSAIVDLLPRRRERAVQLSYRSHAYDVINQRLDLLASEIGSALQVAGTKPSRYLHQKELMMNGFVHHSPTSLQRISRDLVGLARTAF